MLQETSSQYRVGSLIPLLFFFHLSIQFEVFELHAEGLHDVLVGKAGLLVHLVVLLHKQRERVRRLRGSGAGAEKWFLVRNYKKDIYDVTHFL